ncbi:hypothetical protein Q4602_21980 [Paraglaciecola chathamensis]|uniref:hypothetical protein n=1 Tax=Paraglaciecola chathamensis TaxID=368405 RepID=UPI00271064E7|nr:hypothetical protein [Paraglaciecola chathamensis]MDO6842150.1 hypothetical protein [Paraglaciecola chathamensis]
MRNFTLVFLLIFPIYAFSKSVLIHSDHTTPAGQAEIRSFTIDCINSCYFTIHLIVNKLDFDTSAESGAMYRVWNENKTASILYGVNANKTTQKPEVVVLYTGDNVENKKFTLGASKLGDWEGFRFHWTDVDFEISVLRKEKKETYTILKESLLSHEDNLFFKPYSIEYLFLGVDVDHYLDIGEQNINQEWTKVANGN